MLLGPVNTEGNNNYLQTSWYIVLCILLVCFFLFIFAVLHLLVIGRASVVSSAPLAVLSLLPSILISIAAWIIKSTLLENNEHDDDTKDHDTTKDDNATDGNDKDEGDENLKGITTSATEGDENPFLQNEGVTTSTTEGGGDGDQVTVEMAETVTELYPTEKAPEGKTEQSPV